MIILALHQRNWKFGGLLKNLMTFSYYLRLRELKQIRPIINVKFILKRSY